jgi:hypothetical protein
LDWWIRRGLLLLREQDWLLQEPRHWKCINCRCDWSSRDSLGQTLHSPLECSGAGFLHIGALLGLQLCTSISAGRQSGRSGPIASSITISRTSIHRLSTLQRWLLDNSLMRGRRARRRPSKSIVRRCSSGVIAWLFPFVAYEGRAE